MMIYSEVGGWVAGAGVGQRMERLSCIAEGCLDDSANEVNPACCTQSNEEIKVTTFRQLTVFR